MSQTTTLPKRWIALGLFVLAFSARLIDHPWNLSPLTAVALFAAVTLPRRWALLLPLMAMALTDPILGWHATIPFTWASVLLIGCLGLALRSHYSLGRSVLFAGMGSVLFFIVTNFGVWVTGQLYAPTAEGLIQCYTAAIPFFRHALLGDIVFTFALFGLYDLSANTMKQPLPEVE